MKDIAKPQDQANRSHGQKQGQAHTASTASPVPAHTTPGFAPSPLTDKDVRASGKVNVRTMQSPAGSLTFDTVGEPQAVPAPKPNN